ncbi:MAG: hypothetical protein M0R80_17530 [Proteobacteria bacterium]|jgi:hypothetical protein|nr:hypothetical protein [Pseudomonadota bacterium]
MEINELNKKTCILADLRRMKDSVKEEIDTKRSEFETTIEAETTLYKNMLGKIDEVQNEILEELRKDNLTQWKTPDATISRKFTTKYSIIDKALLISDLVLKKLDKEYTMIDVKPEVKTLFDKIELAGVEKTETDYISVIVKKVGQENGTE